MKEVIYGTTNAAKVKQLREVLGPHGFAVTSLADFGKEIFVNEDGATSEENARKKALVYARELDKPVLSMDFGLYFDGVPDDRQPGQYIRRFMNATHGDGAVLAYYAELIGTMGDRINGYWNYAFAIGRPDGECVSFTLDVPRIFVRKPSRKVVPGFPLMSLQIDADSGQYLSDMSPSEMAALWRKSIGTPLVEFVKKYY